MFAATGMIILVIIHLWNVRQGKVLKVGSVALLSKQTTKTTSSIKLHDLLLLILRCLLILLLAILLAQPQWTNTAAENKGWVLVDKNDMDETYRHFKPQIDSLLNAGLEFHYFNNQFEKGSLQRASVPVGDSAENDNYWVTARQLNKKAGGKMPLYIFTNNYLHHFTGNRPATPATMHWQAYTAGDSAKFPLDEYAIDGDSILAETAHSSATGTYNTWHTLKNSVLKNSPLKTVDTAILRICVFAPGNSTDAVYVKAAIEAIQQFSRRKITLSIINSIAAMPPIQDWLFWLSQQPVPGVVKAKNILQYENGKEENIQSWIVSQGNPVLYKQISAGINNRWENMVIWRDGFGRALLREDKGEPNIFHFYTHFNPSWSDLVWSNDFPAMIYSLLFNKSAGLQLLHQKDKRAIDDRQLQPYHLNEKITGNHANATNISPFFGLLAIVVFFIERAIALMDKKGGANA